MSDQPKGMPPCGAAEHSFACMYAAIRESNPRLAEKLRPKVHPYLLPDVDAVRDGAEPTEWRTVKGKGSVPVSVPPGYVDSRFGLSRDRDGECLLPSFDIGAPPQQNRGRELLQTPTERTARMREEQEERDRQNAALHQRTERFYQNARGRSRAERTANQLLAAGTAGRERQMPTFTQEGVRVTDYALPEFIANPPLYDPTDLPAAMPRVTRVESGVRPGQTAPAVSESNADGRAELLLELLSDAAPLRFFRPNMTPEQHEHLLDFRDKVKKGVYFQNCWETTRRDPEYYTICLRQTLLDIIVRLQEIQQVQSVFSAEDFQFPPGYGRDPIRYPTPNLSCPSNVNRPPSRVEFNEEALWGYGGAEIMNTLREALRRAQKDHPGDGDEAMRDRGNAIFGVWDELRFRLLVGALPHILRNALAAAEIKLAAYVARLRSCDPERRRFNRKSNGRYELDPTDRGLPMVWRRRLRTANYSWKAHIDRIEQDVYSLVATDAYVRRVTLLAWGSTEGPGIARASELTASGLLLQRLTPATEEEEAAVETLDPNTFRALSSPAAAAAEAAGTLQGAPLAVEHFRRERHKALVAVLSHQFAAADQQEVLSALRAQAREVYQLAGRASRAFLDGLAVCRAIRLEGLPALQTVLDTLEARANDARDTAVTILYFLRDRFAQVRTYGESTEVVLRDAHELTHAQLTEAGEPGTPQWQHAQQERALLLSDDTGNLGSLRADRAGRLYDDVRADGRALQDTLTRRVDWFVEQTHDARGELAQVAQENLRTLANQVATLDRAELRTELTEYTEGRPKFRERLLDLGKPREGTNDKYLTLESFADPEKTPLPPRPAAPPATEAWRRFLDGRLAHQSMRRGAGEAQYPEPGF